MCNTIRVFTPCLLSRTPGLQLGCAPNCLNPAKNSLPGRSGDMRENRKTRFQTSSIFFQNGFTEI